MPDQESTALASPPVAPAPQVSSLYDGLRVRLAPAVAVADQLAGGGLNSLSTIVKAGGQEVKDIVADPKKRADFLTGLVSTGPEGEGAEEGAAELEGEAKKLYEGLRVRKANEVMVQPETSSRATPTGKGGTLPPEIHADLEKQAGRELSSDEAVALDRANLERGMITAPKGNTSELEKPASKPKGKTVVSEHGKPYEEQRYPHDQPVKVTWPEHNDSIVDKVKGLNKGHAVARAKANWPGAEIEPIEHSDYAKGLAKEAGLVYKDEAVRGTGIHQFEHPDHPGKTIAVKEADLTTPEALKSRMAAKLAENPIVPKVATNASGESPASQEAINRTSSEKLGGVKRIRIDTRSGKETPLIGVDAVDTKAGPWDKIVTRDAKGKETLLDKGAKVQNNRQNANSMDDPEARFSAARHEAGHAVVSELLRPGAVKEVGLDDSGGYTNTAAPGGKTKTKDLSPEEIKNLVAVSYAGGLSEPGGTTAQHVSTDQRHRANILAGGGATLGANLSRLATGGTLGQDKFLSANTEQADARARVNALLADPKNRAAIDALATKINEKGSLTGDEVRKYLAGLK